MGTKENIRLKAFFQRNLVISFYHPHNDAIP